MDMRKYVLRQTGIVGLGEAIGVAAMIGIFALLGQFDGKVLLGGIIGGLVAIANFLVMAIGVNLAADKAEIKHKGLVLVGNNRSALFAFKRNISVGAA